MEFKSEKVILKISKNLSDSKILKCGFYSIWKLWSIKEKEYDKVKYHNIR